MARKKRKREEKMGAELRLLLAELERQKRQTRMLLAGVLAIAVAIASIVGYNMFIGSQRAEFLRVGIEEGKIKIRIDAVDDGRIHYFVANDTKFYIHKNYWGNIHARISLCEPCAGDTFTVLDNGKVIDCDVCHTRWDAETYEGIYPAPGEQRVGGCEDYPPAYLPYTIEDSYIVILEENLR
jgi:uncharacterized membrane protein